MVALSLAAWGVPRDERDVRCRYVVRGLDDDLLWWMPPSFDYSDDEVHAVIAVSCVFLGALVERRNREQIKAVAESKPAMTLLMSAVKSTFPGVANAGAFGLSHLFASAPVTSTEALRNSDELRNALLERLGDVAWIQSKAICAHHDGRSDADSDGAEVVNFGTYIVKLAADGSHRDWHPTNRLGEGFWVRLAIAWIGAMQRSMSKEGAAFEKRCRTIAGWSPVHEVELSPSARRDPESKRSVEAAGRAEERKKRYYAARKKKRKARAAKKKAAKEAGESTVEELRSASGSANHRGGHRDCRGGRASVSSTHPSLLLIALPFSSHIRPPCTAHGAL